MYGIHASNLIEIAQSVFVAVAFSHSSLSRNHFVGQPPPKVTCVLKIGVQFTKLKGPAASWSHQFILLLSRSLECYLFKG